MDAERTWQVIERERTRLVEVLDGLGHQQWERPSLCEGWTVRDVAAHLTVVSDPPSWTVLLGQAVRVRGNPHRLNTAVTKHRAQRPPREIVAILRRNVASRDLPFVTSDKNVLFDLLVHVQDIAVPLGIDVPMPTDAAADSATRVWTMGWPFRARRRLAGFTLIATDAPWSVGSGPEVHGPIAALLLLLTGRPAALPQLSGPGAAGVARTLAGHADDAASGALTERKPS